MAVGQSILRREGKRKLTGQAEYIDDVPFNGLYGVTVRSTVPRAKIKKIEFLDGVPWEQITVVQAKDIPGKNYVALILQDQPFLADQVVNHPEEPILLLAHADKYIAEKARSLVKIQFDDLPPIFSMDDSLTKKELIWGQDNIFKSYLLEKGNVESAWSSAYKIVEGEYFTGAQEQLYIETNGMIAQANPTDGVTVWGSMQCPYYVHKALLPLFNLSEEKIRIIQTETGGGFGGKEEYPSILAGHAALLAWKSGQSVKMIYDRTEDMTATTKRHPSRTRHKTALSKDGKILAMDIDFVIDGGAYATLSSVVLSRGTIHSAGPYFCENVRVSAKAVATNHPPHGAFRGFGAPQSLFALERHLDKCAEQLGLSVVEFRRRNFLKDGMTTATGQVVKDHVDMNQLLDKALEKADYQKKLKEYLDFNSKSRDLKKGIGFATFFHGCGFTGSGEKYLASKVGMRTTSDGKVQVLAASTEIGQGTNTIFSQIAADALNVSVESVEVFQPDTAYVPNSGPTVASRTTMVVGKLVESAAIGLRQTLQQEKYLGTQYSEIDFTKACQKYHADHGELKIIVDYQAPPNIHWDDVKYQGEAYGSYAWAVYVADVEVDMVTMETKVQDFVALQEIGKVMNPVMAAGQIEGGVAQGIGYALYEKVVWKNGRMMNGQMTNYIMPTSADLPSIRVFFDESPYQYGPSGAKGIGELPMDGPAPAILNAVNVATQLEVNSIPMLPEDLFEKWEHRNA